MSTFVFINVCFLALIPVKKCCYFFAKILLNIRENKKQSQELLSGLAGIGRTHLSAIERGERKPTLETFFKISEALGIKPAY